MDRIIEVQWEQGLLFSRGWVIERETLSLPFRALFRLPRGLRRKGMVERFEGMVGGTKLLRRWDQICGGTGDKTFLLRFSTGRWDVPWELLLSGLQESLRPTVCLARALFDESVPAGPATFTEPLRILILQGDDGAKIGAPLNLAGELNEILRAWGNLESGVQQCIAQPVAANVTRANLIGLLAQHRPHILWFSGHGRTRGTTQLLFCDSDWVDANVVANLIQQSGHIPVYAVFWACETAVPESERTLPSAPSLFRELRRAGVLSLLAMQAPIRDTSAAALAGDLFRFLALGLPLEKATARARANQMMNAAEHAHPLDWACPVVWSAGTLVDKLVWNAPSRPLAQLQVLSRQVARIHLPFPSILEDPTEELARARVWTGTKRIWISGTWQDGDHFKQWIQTLRAIQIETELFVVAIDLKDKDPALSLRDWAQTLYARLVPHDVPDELAILFSQMAGNPIPAWRELCRREGTMIAVSGAPAFRPGDWFWEPLLAGAASTVAILSNAMIEMKDDIPWSFDSLQTNVTTTSIATAIDRAPDLARALALLNLPLHAHRIRLNSPGVQGVRALSEWQEGQSLLVQTSAGPLMAATARQAVVEQMEETEVERAHAHCVELLGEPTLSLNAELREQRLLHLIGAGLFAEALEEAAILCATYRQERRPVAVLNVVHQLSSRRTDLPSPSKIIVAWAYLRLGRLKEARFWLDRADMLSSPLDHAKRHGLSAEIFKSVGSEGSKDAALEEINAAIALSEEAAGRKDEFSSDARRLGRAFRQDRARVLQYLFYQKETAAGEYEKLLEEWSTDPDAEDIAVVKRNLAECLRTMPDALAQHQRIGDLLQEAEQALLGRPDAPVLAEILYERSRTAEQDGRTKEAELLLQRCMDAAVASRNFLVLAIAKNRHFWHFSTFDPDKWDEIKDQLKAYFPHGWAVRACITGRIRVARQYEKIPDPRRAYSELLENFQDFVAHPSFDAGSDRSRIAVTMAGLQLLGAQIGKTEDSWNKFLQYKWSSQWLTEQAKASPEEIWQTAN